MTGPRLTSSGLATVQSYDGSWKSDLRDGFQIPSSPPLLWSRDPVLGTGQLLFSSKKTTHREQCVRLRTARFTLWLLRPLNDYSKKGPKIERGYVVSQFTTVTVDDQNELAWQRPCLHYKCHVRLTTAARKVIKPSTALPAVIPFSPITTYDWNCGRATTIEPQNFHC